MKIPIFMRTEKLQGIQMPLVESFMAAAIHTGTDKSARSYVHIIKVETTRWHSDTCGQGDVT